LTINIEKLAMEVAIDSSIALKQIDQSDALDIFNTINSQRPYLGKWLPFVAATKELSDTESFIDAVTHAAAEKAEYVFVIRKESVFVGVIGFKSTDLVNKKTEIGYWISEHFQKQGIVTKSVDKLCAFAFNEMDMNRVQIKCAVGNTASIQIPLRLGFTYEGIERQGELLTGNVFADLQVYSKLKCEMNGL
jgi:ribosomal-protein-serine acetyltransferase